jgi:hypothetical protein
VAYQGQAAGRESCPQVPKGLLSLSMPWFAHPYALCCDTQLACLGYTIISDVAPETPARRHHKSPAGKAHPCCCCCCGLCRASYQQQYEAAVSALQAQHASNLSDVTSLNRYLQDMGLTAQQQGSRQGTPQQQQQVGPMQELVLRLQGVRAALEARAAAHRAAQQQLEAQVGGWGWCSCGATSSETPTASNPLDCNKLLGKGLCVAGCGQLSGQCSVQSLTSTAEHPTSDVCTIGECCLMHWCACLLLCGVSGVRGASAEVPPHCH